MKKRLKILLVSWLILSFIFVGFGTIRWSRADESTDNILLFASVLNFINKFYVDEVKLRDIVYPAIKEMVSKLDPHSRFLTPEEVQKEKEDEQKEREYTGVGMIFGAREDLKLLKEKLKSEKDLASDKDAIINKITFEIKKIFNGSPAQRAGLLPKDEIVKIDGVLAQDIGAEEVAKINNSDKKIAEKFEQFRKKIIGPAGTTVILTIKRERWSEPRDFVITREKIQLKNVEWKIIESGGKKFGYLRIESFMPDTTAKEVAKATKEFKSRKIEGAIIDLRNNSGGRLNYCLRVLENFLPPNTLIISEKGKIGQQEVKTDDNYTEYFTAPLVVLINDGSASASEIIAGALRDYKRAILIGKRTYGKGSVQIVIDLPDGSLLNLTIFKYFLPNGESIHEIGISPNIETETEFDEPIISEALKVLKDWKTYQKKFLE